MARTPRFHAMRLAVLALLIAAAPAWAFPAPDPGWPTQHQIDSRANAAPPQPYAMTYSDEAAQALGVRDGQWEAFNTRSDDPLVPSFKGGVDHGAAMLRLQWTPN